MKEKWISGLLATLLVLSAGPTSAFAAEDTSLPPHPTLLTQEEKNTPLPAGHWAEKEVNQLVGAGYLHLDADGHFQPNRHASRAEIADALWRISGKPVVNYALSFQDVQEDSETAEAIRWAASEQLMSGYGDGSFGPENPVTREQLAAVLYRYVQKFGMGFQGAWMFPLRYEDVDEMSEWADEPMHWMVASHLMQGDGTLLKPKGTVTRAQEAVILSRLLDLAKEKEVDFSHYASRSETPGTAQLANPFVSCISLKKATALAGFPLTIPETLGAASEKTYRAVLGDMVEVIYSDQDAQEVGRIRKGNGSEDISGDYTAYASEEVTEVNGAQVQLKGNDGAVSTAVWTKDGFSYAVTLNLPMSPDAILNLISEIA